MCRNGAEYFREEVMKNKLQMLTEIKELEKEPSAEIQKTRGILLQNFLQEKIVR